jgi:hypothetical protein
VSVLARQVRDRIGQLLLVIVALIVAPATASCGTEDEEWIPLRNHNPFLQVYGLPPFQDAVLAADGEIRYRVSLDVVNHADASEAETESITLDGESYFLALSMQYGVTHWLELGIDLPLVAHADGFLDNGIEGWHDFWGLSNSRRDGPSNQLRFSYDNPAVSSYELTSQSFGIGDVQLTAAVPLIKSGDPGGGALALRSSIKLPTGDEEVLRGSGAFDFSLGIYGSTFAVLGERDLDFSGFAGVLFPGEGDIFPALQRSAVAFGGAGATWRMTDRFSIGSQIYAQDSYHDADLREIGGSSVQIALAGAYRFPRQRVSFVFALVEDVISNGTPDFALHFSVHGFGGL